MTSSPSEVFSRQDRLWLWLHFALIMLIYASTGYYSPGFDDEYFNLMIVEKFGTSVAAYTQSTDVHPPLSYLLNAWLLKILGNWEWIRMISGIATATSMIALILKLGKNRRVLFSLILIYLLAFNPAMLMWGTSLRWYGYFFPMLIWLIVIPSNTRWVWPKFFISFLLMGYTGYISFFIFPVFFLYYWMNDHREMRTKIVSIILPALLAALIYLPQLMIFFRVHYPRSGGQIFSLPSGFLGVFSTHFSNQGVFPLSFPGIISAMGTVILLILVFNDWRKEWRRPFFIPFGLGQVILVISKIAGKMRNLSVMVPLQSVWFADKINQYSSKWKWVAAGLIIFGNITGTYNVIRHEDTTKNSWNIPVDQVKYFVEHELKTEKSAVLVYSHDPIITWHFEKMGYAVRSPYAHQEINVKGKKFKQVVSIWTNPGYIPKQRMDLFHFEIDLIKKTSAADYVMGVDKYASIKRRKEPLYPDELVKINVLNDPEQIAEFSVWAPVFVKRFR